MPTGLVEQRLEVRDVDAVGTYAGKLTLHAGKADTVTVEAKVRDVILWPLVVAGLAALIGGYAATYGRRWRTRQLLRSELSRARGIYDANRENSPVGPPSGPASPDAIADLETAVGAAKGDEELDELSKSVTRARDAMQAWAAIDRSARRVTDLQGEGFAHHVDAVQRDTQNVLDAAAWIPGDVDGVAAIETQLHRQESILRAFDRAHRLWPGLAEKAYASETEAWKDDGTTAQLIGLLNRVEEPPDILVVEPGDVAESEKAQAASRERLLARAFDDIKTLSVRDLRAEASATPTVRLTPEQLERPVRRWDWTMGSF